MGDQEPGAIHREVEEAFNAADVERLVALYEPDAQMVTPEGTIGGIDAIRAN
ncbi:MAG: hypothetical protein JWM05_1999, partial [Acidimicrobiales bacterium]|nr:hypothetical protein [Acidimicrobiales bacterium]